MADFRSPSYWNTMLAASQPWASAYAAVEEAVRRRLTRPDLGQPRLSTAELVEALYPEAQARGDGITARKRLFKALAALAKHQLKGYCEPGPTRKLKHGSREITPLIWRAPPAAAPITRYHLDTVLHSMVEHGYGEWVRWDDVKDRLK